jgi:hypothetical protein
MCCCRRCWTCSFSMVATRSAASKRATCLCCEFTQPHTSCVTDSTSNPINGWHAAAHSIQLNISSLKCTVSSTAVPHLSLQVGALLAGCLSRVHLPTQLSYARC